MVGAFDADDMRARAAECRLFSKTAVPPVARGEWLKAAEQWDALAREVDAWRASISQPDGVAQLEDEESR